MAMLCYVICVTHRIVFDQVVSSLLLCLSSNLTDHDDPLGVLVGKEQLEAVNEVCSIEGISADSDTQRLAEADSRGLVDGLIGEGPRPGDHAHNALLVDVAGHDADLAGAGGDDAGAVGANQTGLALAEQGVLDLDHVLLGNAWASWKLIS